MLTFITINRFGLNMPSITASLSEAGYEGYRTIPKGMRSQVIDRMLRDYALNRHHITPQPGDFEKLTVQQALDKIEFTKKSLATLFEENRELKKKLRGEEE